MSALSTPSALLDAWEHGARVPPAARAAVLVHRAGLTSTLDDALDLDVGRCADLALLVYRETFGDVADAVVGCPACGEVVEAQLSVPQTHTVGRGTATAGLFGSQTSHEQVVGRWVVRAPTTRDLLVAARGQDDAKEVLLSRCVTSVATGADLSRLTAEELTELDAAAEDLAGSAVLTSTLTCHGCGEVSQIAYDVGMVLWDQIEITAPALLADVATLARAFGWGEAEVLALSETRRRAYLTLVAR